jgi:hypothetical protein
MIPGNALKEQESPVAGIADSSSEWTWVQDFFLKQKHSSSADRGDEGDFVPV